MSEEDEFALILVEASKRMREWSSRYMCQDVNLKHGLDYWVYVVTKEKIQSQE